MDKALLGGLRPQRVIAIGGRSGTGKSFVVQKILETLMDENVNPQAKDYVLLRCEFEMNPADLLVRRLARELNRSVEDIVSGELTDYEIRRMQKVVEAEKSDRIFYIPKPCSVEEFSTIMNDRFLPYFKDKKLVIVSIDHIALVKRLGGEPKKVIDGLLAEINEMKLKYKNVVFIILTQFNRGIEDRKDPRSMAPQLCDIYQSDELAQLCELVIGLHYPSSLGIDSYMIFSPNKYESLDRFKWPDKKHFRTDGLLFHHILKTRMKNMYDKKYPLDDIYIEVRRGKEELYGLSETGEEVSEPTMIKEIPQDKDDFFDPSGDVPF